MQSVDFVKMHGLGNDFVVLNGFCMDIQHPGELAATMCDRHFGVGADGLIAVLPSDVADCRMRIFNADGSEAEMCGNGVRCTARFFLEFVARKDADRVDVETASGIRTILIDRRADGTTLYTADMGRAVPLPYPVPEGVTPISTGNPHGVVFVDDVHTYQVETIGPEFENHRAWPAKANIEFVTVRSGHAIDVRAWERGAGETLACGTGACAAAKVAVDSGRCSWPVEVSLPGGRLLIGMSPEGHILMSGPADVVFIGKTI